MTAIEEDEEEALMALYEHRFKEVQHLRDRLDYYESQLNEAEKKLDETQRQLSRVRSRGSAKSSIENLVRVKKETTPSPLKLTKKCNVNLSDSQPEEDCKIINTQQKPTLHIPFVTLKRPSPFDVSSSEDSTEIRSQSCFSVPRFKKKPKLVKAAESQPNLVATQKRPPCVEMEESCDEPSKFGSRPLMLNKPEKAAESQARGTKKKSGKSKDRDLIEVVNSCSSPIKINCETSSYIPSQHKRKLRTLVLCPTNDELFVTSALDGIVNLWKIQGKGSHVIHQSSINAASLKQRRWPEDVAWHPNGSSMIFVYSADGGDSQIAVMDMNKGQKVTFLEHKPHVKGTINNVMFMPWDRNSFITGGNDHAVVHWSEKPGENCWKPNVLHKTNHTSAVMGVAGIKHTKTVISVGADRKIIGFDLETERTDIKHQIDSKCMSVLPNPRDSNLFMIQTGTPERQLRLYDMRLKGDEIHGFGWKQESSASQSSLINQAWSSDGLYLTSGSADPMIHIFDIRLNANQPSQSIKAHQKRVFKAAWHQSLPLLISISSDLNIGLHKII
ncbi:transducin family protein / WD-40 repeat family protein [Artemisia annua]|uniref:Transducin family protein / WD-40 repeat family protein n=1 Tax=Artemisia annua TaxID=35608 RepID=A0A2U1QJ53_ARTAN|nr:transducin family protein / WD-40 repeat family protein [Artemisia annua]